MPGDRLAKARPSSAIRHETSAGQERSVFAIESGQEAAPLRVGERSIDLRDRIGGPLHGGVVLANTHAKRAGGGRDIAAVFAGMSDKAARLLRLAPMPPRGACRIGRPLHSVTHLLPLYSA